MDPEKTLQDELKQVLAQKREEISREDIVDILTEAVTVSQADIMRTLGFRPSAIFIHIACIAFATDGFMVHPDEFPRIMKALNGEPDESDTPLRVCDKMTVSSREKMRALDMLRVAMFKESMNPKFGRPQPVKSPEPKIPRIAIPGHVGSRPS